MSRSPLSHKLRMKIADELDCARKEIEQLGGLLCSDPDLVAAHMTSLQALDMIGQQQLALAAILRADDPQAAIAGTTLEQLRKRLEQALD